MNIINLVQGSPEWLAYRATHFNASDAPAMMGVSPYKSRAELLREMHTGLAADVDVATQKRFDNGHRVEALARPLAEEFIGKELFPVVGELGKLSASFDGLTMDDSEGFEHKALNAELRAAFATIDTGASDHYALPIHHRIQMEQQLLISGANRILFMSSEWAGEELVEEHHCWYYSSAELREKIIAGWAQFESDLAAYVPPAASAAAPAGRAPETLPALRIEVSGAVTSSNLAEFKAVSLGAIRSVNRDLQTDQDFADAEKAVKWCGDVEDRLQAAKQHALSQTTSIEALFRTMDDIGAEARRVRLDLEKLVKARKESIRTEMVSDAILALRSYVAGLNAELLPASLPHNGGDFAGAIKGKRSIDTMRDAIADELAACKIEAEGKARIIRANLAMFKKNAAGYELLFPDLGTLAHKAPDDFEAIAKTRITAHDQAEAEKKRIADDAAAKAITDELLAQAALKQADVGIAAAVSQASASIVARVEQTRLAELGRQAVQYAEQIDMVSAAREAEPVTLKLGDIGARLGFVVNAAFVADTLGIKPAKTDGRAMLYRESDWPRICAALVRHIQRVAELQPA